MFFNRLPAGHLLIDPNSHPVAILDARNKANLSAGARVAQRSRNATVPVPPRTARWAARTPRNRMVLNRPANRPTSCVSAC